MKLIESASWNRGRFYDAELNENAPHNKCVFGDSKLTEFPA